MSDQIQPTWVTNGLDDLGFHETGDSQGIEAFIAQAHCGSVGDPWCAIWANAKLEESGITGTLAVVTVISPRPKLRQARWTTLGAIAMYLAKFAGFRPRACRLLYGRDRNTGANPRWQRERRCA